eukprot:gene7959-8157_t
MFRVSPDHHQECITRSSSSLQGAPKTPARIRGAHANVHAADGCTAEAADAAVDDESDEQDDFAVVPEPSSQTAISADVAVSHGDSTVAARSAAASDAGSATAGSSSRRRRGRVQEVLCNPQQISQALQLPLSR